MFIDCHIFYNYLKNIVSIIFFSIDFIDKIKIVFNGTDL